MASKSPDSTIDQIARLLEISSEEALRQLAQMYSFNTASPRPEFEEGIRQVFTEILSSDDSENLKAVQILQKIRGGQDFASFKNLGKSEVILPGELVTKFSERLISEAVETGRFTSLNFIDLKMDSLPKGIGKVYNLEKLYFDNNLVSDFQALKSLKSLKTLSIVNNPITEIHLKEYLLQLPALKELQLGGTAVSNFPKEVLNTNSVEKMRDYYGLNKLSANNEDVSYATSFTLFSKPKNILFDTEKVVAIYRDLIINAEGSDEKFFGLFGRWGRGKTYFWNLLKQKMKQENENYIPVEFHAWKYQDTPAVWAYLYDQLAEHYNPKPDKWYHLRAWLRYARKPILLSYHRGKLLRPIIALAGKLALLALVIFALVQFVPADRIAEWKKQLALWLAIPASLYGIFEFSKRSFQTNAQSILQGLNKKVSFADHLGIQHEIQKELVYLLKAWIPTGAANKILLFVDDIDRCSEDKIIQIVDYIRVLLHHPDIEKRMSVMAAIDERILMHAIRVKYRSFINDESNDATYRQLCREYIDKLFIASLKLGPLTDFERQEIVGGFTHDVTRRELQKKSEGTQSHKNETMPGEQVAEHAVIQDTDEKVQGEILRALRPNDEMTVSALTGKIQYTPGTQKGLQADFAILEPEEQQFLMELVRNFAVDATPRSIRVFTVRYLLGKRLIEKPLRTGNQSHRQWFYTQEGKRFFACLLANYTFIDANDPETLAHDYAAFLRKHNTRDFRDGEATVDRDLDFKRTCLQQEHALRPTLASIIYQVLSMVVAY